MPTHPPASLGTLFLSIAHVTATALIDGTNGYAPFNTLECVRDLLPPEHQGRFGKPFSDFLAGRSFTGQVTSIQEGSPFVLMGTIVPRDNAGTLHPKMAIPFSAKKGADAHSLELEIAA